MKRVIWVVMMLFLLSVTSFATDSFKTSELSAEEIERSNDVGVVLLEDEPEKGRVKCFAVNSNGSYAVGLRNGSINTVIVYNSNNEFMYAFCFSSEGDYGIAYHEDTISICLVRGSLLLKINPDGEVISVERILDTSENNALWGRLLSDDDIVVGKKTYALKGKRIFADQYAELVVIDSIGNERVLYRAADDYKYDTLKDIVVSVVVVMCCFLASLYVLKKYNRRNDHHNSDIQGTIVYPSK